MKIMAIAPEAAVVAVALLLRHSGVTEQSQTVTLIL